MLNWAKLIRVHQWTKNLICFAGVIFSGNLFHCDKVSEAFLVFFLFCIASSAVYIFNDIIDRDKDKLHDQKKYRPLANGTISLSSAALLCIILFLLSGTGAFFMSRIVFIIVMIYFLNNLLYTLWWKHLLLIDVISISIGFILRLLAGIYAIDELPTTWILLCALFLALFLGFGKRRAELFHLAHSTVQRPVLDKYNISFLDSMLNNTAILSVFSYSLFTILSPKTQALVITIPMVFYALHYYMYLITIQNSDREPDELFLKDRHLQISILLWLVVFVILYYFHIQIFEFGIYP